MRMSKRSKVKVKELLRHLWGVDLGAEVRLAVKAVLPKDDGRRGASISRRPLLINPVQNKFRVAYGVLDKGKFGRTRSVAHLHQLPRTQERCSK